MNANFSTHLNTMHWLDEYWTVNGDPRVAHYAFMASSRPALLILVSYLSFVLYFGPKLMANRKPFSLKAIMLIYNAAMSLANVYFLVQFLRLHNYGADMWNTSKPSFADRSPATQSVIALHHLYVLSKFVDLLDTIFFVLRKKTNQLTALHIYHHTSVPVQAWTYFRLVGNDSLSIPFALLNSLVHALMYAYYGLAAMGAAPSLRWKRRLTQLQIVQFIALLAAGFYFLIRQKDYPLYFTFNLLVQSALYIVLFSRFYLHAYSPTNSRGGQTGQIASKRNLE